MTLQVLQRWTADFSPILWVFPRDCLLKVHYKHISQIFQSVSNFAMLKGQIMSECINEIIDFPKYQQKKLIDFCPGRFERLGTCDLVLLFTRRLESGECITYLV